MVYLSDIIGSCCRGPMAAAGIPDPFAIGRMKAPALFGPSSHYGYAREERYEDTLPVPGYSNSIMPPSIYSIEIKTYAPPSAPKLYDIRSQRSVYIPRESEGATNYESGSSSGGINHQEDTIQILQQRMNYHQLSLEPATNDYSAQSRDNRRQKEDQESEKTQRFEERRTNLMQMLDSQLQPQLQSQTQAMTQLQSQTQVMTHEQH